MGKEKDRKLRMWKWRQFDHLSVSELTRYVTGNIKFQKPIKSRRPKLSSLSVKRVERIRNN